MWPQLDRWRATSGYDLWRRPDEGMLPAWRYGVWRMVEIRPVAEVDLTDAQLAKLADRHRPIPDWLLPYVLVIAHVHGPILDETVRLHDGTRTIHLEVTPSDHRSVRWHALGEHCAVCVQCGDPHPCGEQETTRAAAKAAQELKGPARCLPAGSV